MEKYLQKVFTWIEEWKKKIIIIAITLQRLQNEIANLHFSHLHIPTKLLIFNQLSNLISKLISGMLHQLIK